MKPSAKSPSTAINWLSPRFAIFKETRAFFAYETDANGNFVGQPHPLDGPGPLNGIITITGTGRTSGLMATCIFTVTK